MAGKTLYEQLIECEHKTNPEQCNQIELVASKLENVILKEALEGGRSISQTLEEIARRHTGIRALLPKRRDEEYNSRVASLTELLPHTSHFFTRGAFFPDNPVTITAYALPLLFPATHVMAASYNAPRYAFWAAPFAWACAIAFFGSMFFSLGAPVPRREAEYLDRKLEELFDRQPHSLKAGQAYSTQ